MAGTKINEYPQAAALNDTDLLVMDQVQSGIHSTKSVSISQITDKATSGLSGDNIPIEAGSQDSISDAVGDLSSLSTTNNDSLVDAVNEVVGDITSLENDRMITENITVPSISFATWVPNINYADVNITTTYTISSGASVIVQSAHKQVLVVSSSGANKTIDLRVITFGSSSQTSVQFKVIYKKA